MTQHPGVFELLSMAKYKAIDAINMSSLNSIRKSPAHLKAKLETEYKRSEAFLLGELVHCLCLEPESFRYRYVVGPNVDKRTKEWKEWVLKNGGGNEVISNDTLSLAESIAASVINHPTFKPLRNVLKTEVSLVWEDAETNELCKGRLDAISFEHGVVLDIKTTRDASFPSFQRDLFSLGYDNKAAWYLSGLKRLGFDIGDFLFFAVEKEPPYACAVYRIKDEVLELASSENRDYLKKYACCRKLGEWPGYSADIQDIGIPSWAIKEMEESYGAG
jgi:hypothetical protein